MMGCGGTRRAPRRRRGGDRQLPPRRPPKRPTPLGPCPQRRSPHPPRAHTPLPATHPMTPLPQRTAGDGALPARGGRPAERCAPTTSVHVYVCARKRVCACAHASILGLRGGWAEAWGDGERPSHVIHPPAGPCAGADSLTGDRLGRFNLTIKVRGARARACSACLNVFFLLARTLRRAACNPRGGMPPFSGPPGLLFPDAWAPLSELATAQTRPRPSVLLSLHSKFQLAQTPTRRATRPATSS